MLGKIKENLHLIVICNLILTFTLLITNNQGSNTSVLMLNAEDNRQNEIKVRESICKMAFQGIRNLKMSDFYLHPDIIRVIQDDSSSDFDLKDATAIYFKMENKNICSAIAKLDSGFAAYEAIVSNDGPLHFRVTTIRTKKPTYKEIKELL